MPGIGPVKAKGLLKEFGSLEKIYENLDKILGLPISGAKRLASSLNNNRELAFLSKRLATIVCSIKDCGESFGAFSLDALQVKPIEEIEFDRFLREYDFKENERKTLERIISSITV